MKHIIVATAILLATPGYASYLESCQFTATVTEVTVVPTLNETVSKLAPLAKLEITAAKNQGSHFPEACDNRVGTEQLILLKDGEVLTAGQELKLDYFYANSRSTDGIVQSERWTVISGN
jgi:hypothetical protein